MRKKTTTAVLVTGICGLLIAGAILFAVKLPLAAFGENFRQIPPVSVYQRIFERMPPQGVSQIRASGRHYFTKQWAWLRFHADETARQQFLASLSTLTPLNKAEAQKSYNRIYSANPHYDREDQQAVGWQDTQRVASPEVYEFSNGKRFLNGDPGAWFWNGYLIIDTERDTVFIRAMGD